MDGDNFKTFIKQVEEKSKKQRKPWDEKKALHLILPQY